MSVSPEIVRVDAEMQKILRRFYDDVARVAGKNLHCTVFVWDNLAAPGTLDFSYGSSLSRYETQRRLDLITKKWAKAATPS